jgi:hypothetical protein
MCYLNYFSSEAFRFRRNEISFHSPLVRATSVVLRELPLKVGKSQGRDKCNRSNTKGVLLKCGE